MTDSQWAEHQADREVSAWVRFVDRLDLAECLPVSALVRLLRVPIRLFREAGGTGPA